MRIERFLLVKPWVSSPKYALCKVWLKLALWFWRRKSLKFCQCSFIFSKLSTLGKGHGPSFERTWNPFTKGCYVPTLVEIGPAVLEKIFEFCQCIFAILILSPLGKGMVIYLNKLESPLLKDALCQVWLRLAKRFWRRRFLNFINAFSLFHNYLPLEKCGALHLNKLQFPSPKDTLCQVWLKLV